jgi:hypothetical protein
MPCETPAPTKRLGSAGRPSAQGTRQPRGFQCSTAPSSRLPGERFVAELKPVPSGLGGGRSRGRSSTRRKQGETRGRKAS